MTRNENAPAAWQGHAGQDVDHDPNLLDRLLTVEALRQVIRDIAAMHRAGVGPWAYERCLAALEAHRQRKLQRPIGAEPWVDLLASDVARLVGLDGDLVRSIARGVLLDTPLAAIARELAACRAELSRNSKGAGK